MEGVSLVTPIAFRIVAMIASLNHWAHCLVDWDHVTRQAGLQLGSNVQDVHLWWSAEWSPSAPLVQDAPLDHLYLSRAV